MKTSGAGGARTCCAIHASFFACWVVAGKCGTAESATRQRAGPWTVATADGDGGVMDCRQQSVCRAMQQQEQLPLLLAAQTNRCARFRTHGVPSGHAQLALAGARSVATKSSTRSCANRDLRTEVTSREGSNAPH